MPTKAAPESIETERAILGGVLLENAAWPKIELDPADFFLPAHQTIFLAIRDLLSASSPVDLVILAEELARREQLERIGGAAYLSHLTDGVPRLQNIEHYIKILKEHSQRRRLIRAGTEITRRAEAGEEVGQIAEEFKLTAASESKPEDRPLADHTDKYPIVPEAAWCLTARVYLEAVKNSTSASEAYHLAVFLTVVGAILGRSVFFRMPHPIYPNFYTALVGRSGRAKKGTAIGFGCRLARQVNNEFHIKSSVDSGQGLVEQIAKFQGLHSEKSTAVLFRFAELKGQIEKANREGSTIISTLSEAFDCEDVLEVNTRTNPVQAKKAFVAAVGAASPSWLDKLQMADLEGGIGNRFLWVPGRSREPIPLPPPPIQSKLNAVAQELAGMRGWWGKAEDGKETELVLTPEAEERWRWFYKKVYTLGSEDPLVEIMGERMDQHCIKVAMIYAAIERSPEIGIQHLNPAIVFTQFLIESLYAIFSDFGLSEIMKQQRQIEDHIRRAMPGGIRKRRLQQKLGRMDAETFNRRLRWMTGEEGSIREVKDGRSTYLYMNE